MKKHKPNKSDRWLDDEKSAGGHGRHSALKSGSHDRISEKAVSLEPEEGNATVSVVYPKQCRVIVDADGRELLCPYRRNAVFQRNSDGTRARTPVSVGDRVKVQILGSKDGIVEGVCRRSNELVRPAPGREDAVYHVIAANVDVVVIVASTVEPAFNPGLIDRYLIATQVSKIPSVICVNKIDLVPRDEQPWKLYEDLGIECIPTSVVSGEGLDVLQKRIQGKNAVFSGLSGVGKTSLLNRLLGREIGRTNEISESTSRGQHTTTSALLIPLPDGSRWIDTPGVRGFGLRGVREEEVARYFPEFADLDCTRERNCLHRGEEDCDAGALERHSSYLKIVESVGLGEY